MSEDQRRNAERVPLDIPIEGKIGEISVRIIEISLIGCLLEHSDRMSIGSTFMLRFRWSGENVSLKGRVTRIEMRTADGAPGYLSGIQLAESIDESPEPLQRVLHSLLPDSMPEEIEAAAPSLFADHPFFRNVDDEDEDEVIPPRARVDEAQPEVQVTEGVGVDLELDDEIALQLDDDLAIELPTPFIECTLTNGVWTQRAVSEPCQPREGFTILRPDHDREIAELCHTYLVADPDTRRLIRVTFDLVNAKHGVLPGS